MEEGAQIHEQKHKVGRPFNFSDSYIEFLGFINQGGIPRSLQDGRGSCRSSFLVHLIYQGHLLLADQEEDCQAHEGKETYSEIIGETENSEEPITAIIDSTGLTTTTKGAYIEDKWKEGGEEKVPETAHLGRQKDRQDTRLQDDIRTHRRLEKVWSARQRGIQEGKEDCKGVW